MSIRLDCPCGAKIQANEVFAGGQVKCAQCGQMVAVPDGPQVVDKIHFACPHCNTRVVGRRASVGKASKCPACKRTYIIPEPAAAPESAVVTEPAASPAGFTHRQRIRIEPTDVAFLGEVIGELERKTEVPTTDDTVRPPTRPTIPVIPVVDLESFDPIPLSSYTLPVHPGVKFSPNRGHEPDAIVDLPLETIPHDDIRLVDAEPHVVEKHDEPIVPITSSRLDTIEPQLPAPHSTAPAIESPIVTAPPLVVPRRERSIIVEPRQSWSQASPGIRASLVFVDGPRAGHTVEMTSRNFLVGRERDCQFRPKSASISHHHCVLKSDLFTVRIRDLGSRNGTFVNGHRIHHEVVLHHSDHVRIGDLRFRIDIPDDLYADYASSEAQLSLDEFVIF